MNFREGLDIINDIEEKFLVNKWMVNNILIWPYIRIRLMFMIWRHYDDSCNTKEIKKYSSFEKMLLLAKKTFNQYIFQIIDYKHNDTFHHKAKVAFYSDVVRRNFNSPQGHYDVQCEPFIEIFNKFGEECVLLEASGKGEYRFPRSGKSIYIQNRIDFFNIKKRLFKSIKCNNNFDIDRLNRYFSEKNMENIKISQTELYQNFNFLLNMKDYFKNIMKNMQTRLGMVVCYYGLDGMAFVLACKELGIKSIDIQHGVQGEGHGAYGRWNNVPSSGYELLPDYFWCWSKVEYDAIECWSCNTSRHKAIIGGNLWLEKWRKLDGNYLGSHYDLLRLFPKDKKHILYTLQAEIEIPDYIYNVIRESPDNWQWWFRLHPRMHQKKEEIKKKLFNLNKNIYIDESTNLPLLTLLHHMDVHITVYSTVVIEANEMGVYSIILDESNGELLYSHIIKEGMAGVCSDKESFIEFLRTHPPRVDRKNIPQEDTVQKYLLDLIK